MEIWQEIRKDQESGAKRLVSAYGDRLFAAAALLCRNDSDAEELVFRTFEQAIRKVDTFEPTGDFFNWLYAIMLNFRRMDLRRKRVELIPLGGLADLSSVAGEFVRTLVDHSGDSAVRKALSTIPATAPSARRCRRYPRFCARLSSAIISRRNRLRTWPKPSR